MIMMMMMNDMIRWSTTFTGRKAAEHGLCRRQVGPNL
jgi:hypothetical protein